MRRTEFEVIVSDGECPHFIQQAGVTVERMRSHYSLDEVLARAEEFVLQEWGQVLVFMMRNDEPLPVTYSFWVSEGEV